MKKGLLYKYGKHLPVTADTPIITLHEGETPLIRATNLEKIMPNLEIYFKFEGANPTGSFKDRGMTMAVSHAKEEGSKAIICASTGNTSASAAAYGARAGMKCVVIIPDGKIAMGKLAQAIVYGAKIIPINGNFDQALELVKYISEKYPITLVNSINPYRIEGQKTSAFEICDELGDAPDYLCLPVGNAGNITAYWKGFKEYHKKGLSKSLPHMFGFQASGASPIVDGAPVQHPETIATAIRIGNPASWDKAVEAIEQSNGFIDKRTDEQILEAYNLLAKQEGIFAEPASAISLAGLIYSYKIGKITSGRVVCILTGNGLKDPDCAIKSAQELETVSISKDELEKIIVDILNQ